MDRRKILYIAQELTPYLPETPLAARSRGVAQALSEKGEVRTFMPKYSCINERRNQLHEVIRLSGINLIIDDTDHPLVIKVATLQPTRMQVYFIDNEDYFHHAPAKTLETVSSPADNDDRSIFFVRGVAETVKKLRWVPDTVHCSGWLSALAPLYIKRRHADDPSFRESRIVYSITPPDTLPAPLGDALVEKLRQDGFSKADLAPLAAAAAEGPQATWEQLMLLAIAHSDAIAIETPDLPQALADAIAASGKPVMPYVADETPEALGRRTLEFHDSLSAPK